MFMFKGFISKEKMQNCIKTLVPTVRATFFPCCLVLTTALSGRQNRVTIYTPIIQGRRDHRDSDSELGQLLTQNLVLPQRSVSLTAGPAASPQLLSEDSVRQSPILTYPPISSKRGGPWGCLFFLLRLGFPLLGNLEEPQARVPPCSELGL